MKKLPALVLLCVSVAGLVASQSNSVAPCPDCPPNVRPNNPQPNPQPQPIRPGPQPNPNPRPCPGDIEGTSWVSQLFGTVSISGPLAPGTQTQVQVYLPMSQRIRNIGSRRDGAGMCVMSSIEMMFRWGNLETYRGLRDWCAEQPGGGYPQKVTQQLSQYSQAKNTPLPNWFQYEGSDVALLRASLATGRPVAVTYNGNDRVRYSGTIAHMVLLVHYDDHFVGILDNNAIGEDELLWMTPADFLQRWRGGGQGWAVFSLAVPPPPIPVSR